MLKHMHLVIVKMLHMCVTEGFLLLFWLLYTFYNLFTSCQLHHIPSSVHTYSECTFPNVQHCFGCSTSTVAKYFVFYIRISKCNELSIKKKNVDSVHWLLIWFWDVSFAWTRPCRDMFKQTKWLEKSCTHATREKSAIFTARSRLNI